METEERRDAQADERQGEKPERMKSRAEIHARYVKGIQDYKALLRSQNDPREQRIMLYNEIKALGWVLGKKDKTIVGDLNR